MKATKQARRDGMQLFRFCLNKGLLDEDRTRQVVRQIIDERPRGYLGTLSHFLRLVKLDCARHTAKVQSALPLPADLQVSVQAALSRLYGPGLATTFSDNLA